MFFFATRLHKALNQFRLNKSLVAFPRKNETAYKKRTFKFKNWETKKKEFLDGRDKHFKSTEKNLKKNTLVSWRIGREEMSVKV